MPTAQSAPKNIQLVGGSDEFRVKEAAAALARRLAPAAGGEFGTEIIEGEASNQEQALQILGRLREALGTVGLFGGEKLVWLKNTNLLGDNPTTRAEAVKGALADLADWLKRGLPAEVRLLISAIGCDQRRTLFLTLKKISTVQWFEALDATKEAGQEEVAAFIRDRARAAGKQLSAEALDAFENLVAPDLREIANELEKLFLYVGDRAAITAGDVRAICSASRQAVIWDLIDQLGQRRLPQALAALDNLLGDGESAIGIITLLLNQFRLILLAGDLARRRVLVPTDNKFAYVKAFENLPAAATAHFPRSKEGALPNVWRLYRCAVAAQNFSIAELIRAMELLVEANRQLTSTQLDERLILEQTLTKIVRKPVR